MEDQAMKQSLAGVALAIALALSGTAAAQYAPPPPAGVPPPPPPGVVQPLYAAAQLDQMLAAIALYPDPLLTQMLTAATYPLEIVDADRWLGDPGNAALNDGALATALASQSWDPSVKSLVPFPPILHMMDAHLDWTQALGNAFLAQQSDVMDSIQRLRHDAMAAGTLVSNAQLTVTVNGGYIQIEPASPQYVYIPVYNPTLVYGSWPYPSELPIYYGPPPGLNVGIAAGGISFGLGIGVVGALWDWGAWDWSHHDVRVNTGRFNQINAGRPPVTTQVWQHAPEHRRGVPYSDAASRQRYVKPVPGSAETRRAYRGYEAPQQAAVPPQRSPERAAPQRPAAPQAAPRQPEPQALSRQPALPQAPRPQAAPRAEQRPTAPPAAPRQVAPQRPTTAFTNQMRGPEAQAMSQRGQQSRQAAAAPRPAAPPRAAPPPQRQPQARPQPGRPQERHP
jgi:hypothetical protein